FDYDSSLMARDFTPYRPRIIEVNRESPCVYGRPSSLLELPPSWHLDDVPSLEYAPGINQGQAGTGSTLQQWRSLFDFAYTRVPNPCYIHTVHPQVIGRGHHLLMYEQLLEYISDHDGVWFARLDEIADAWTDEGGEDLWPTAGSTSTRCWPPSSSSPAPGCPPSSRRVTPPSATPARPQAPTRCPPCAPSSTRSAPAPRPAPRAPRRHRCGWSSPAPARR